jgi:hypothetical protein
MNEQVQYNPFSNNFTSLTLWYMTHFIDYSEIRDRIQCCHWVSSICLSIYLYVCLSNLWLYSSCGAWPLFHLILNTVGRTPWTGDQPVARLLPTHRTETQNKPTHTFMTRVGFEPTIPVFERAKTFHALDRAATDNGSHLLLHFYYRMFASCSQQRNYDEPRRSHVW